MPPTTDDVRIREIKTLITPKRVIGEFPQTPLASETVANSRAALSGILHHADDRLAVVVGPCSIHDPLSAMEYAQRLQAVERSSCRRARDRDAGLLRKAANHDWLEGADQ